jgi:hypothetical protein
VQIRFYPMRKRGWRLPWREIENSPSFVGTLQSYRIKCGGHDFQAVSLQSGSSVEGKPLRDLYEPVLVTFATNAFVLRGYERLETSKGVVGAVQEWHCRDA